MGLPGIPLLARVPEVYSRIISFIHRFAPFGQIRPDYRHLSELKPLLFSAQKGQKLAETSRKRGIFPM